MSYREYTINLTGPQIRSLMAIMRQFEAQVTRKKGPNGGIPWSDTRRALLRALRRKGMPVKAIAAELKLSTSAVYRQIAREEDMARIEANNALVNAVAPRPYKHPIYNATLHMKDE